MRDRLLSGFYLGEWHVEPLTGLVIGPGGTRRLHPKAVETLLCLAVHSPNVVTHDELLQSVWGGQGSHKAVSHAVSEIRDALNDRTTAPVFIQTLPRRGYRLLVEATTERAPNSGAQFEKRRPGLLTELTRRGVIETAVAYLVLAWLTIQVANATFTPLALPGWALPFVTYLVIVGFPIALVLAWFIEITPQGPILDLDPSNRPPRKPLRKSYIAIVGALTLASIGVATYSRYVGLPGITTRGAHTSTAPSPAPISIAPNTIAVLPFLSISGDQRTHAFTTGLTEDVIDGLAKVPGLRVAARGDSFSLSANSTSQAVRKRLRVAYYLEGSVRIDNGGLRVVVQLINSANGFHILSRTFNRALKDFFKVQDAITGLTVSSLRVAIPTLNQAQVEPVQSTTSLNAYLLYRRGMDALHQPPTTATIREALDAFQRSLSVDPDYAAAHAGICMTYSSGYNVTSDAAYIGKAEKSCAAALALNGNLNVVDDALGDLYAATGRYEDAESAYKRALAVTDKDVNALIGLGHVLNSEKRLKEAEASFRQAIGLQPGNWRAYDALGKFLTNNGRYPEAVGEFRQIVDLDAQSVRGWEQLSAGLMLDGKFSEATRSFERLIALHPSATSYQNLGLLHYYLGQMDEAIASLEKAVQMNKNDPEFWSNLGDALSFSATPEKATAAFRTAERLAEAKLKVNPRDSDTLTDLAWIEAMLGNLDRADRLIGRAQDAAPTDPYVYFYEALIDVRKRDDSAALDKLEKAVRMGFSVKIIAAEPHLRPLRGNRYRALIANKKK